MSELMLGMYSCLSLWMFLAQVLSGFPAMQEGTRLQIASPDLLTVHGEALVVDGRLVIQAQLVPETEVKLMISFDGRGASSSVLEVYTGVVADGGEDILLLQAEGPPLSLKEFLKAERNVKLFLLPPDEGSGRRNAVA